MFSRTLKPPPQRVFLFKTHAMSEKKHTPGPWKSGQLVDKYGENYLGVFNGKANEGEKTTAVCILSRTADATENDISNARLIRVAPDMLEMLEKIYAATEFVELGNLINRAKNG